MGRLPFTLALLKVRHRIQCFVPFRVDVFYEPRRLKQDWTVANKVINMCFMRSVRSSHMVERILWLRKVTRLGDSPLGIFSFSRRTPDLSFSMWDRFVKSLLDDRLL